MQVLLHTAGITTGTIFPYNSRLITIVHINMIKADGCSSNEFHLASFQQFAVTTGTGTDHQCVSIPYIPGGKTLPGKYTTSSAICSTASCI